MNFSKSLSLIFVPLCVCTAALAQDVGGASPADAPAPTSTMSRAEVLADLQVWRESGLAELQAGESGPDVYSARYRSAEARYAAMRAAPAFAALVDRIARERGERLQIAAK